MTGILTLHHPIFLTSYYYYSNHIYISRVYMVSHPAINSAAHHTIHHLEFNYNYGQYFTLWDRIGGSYKRPDHEFKWNMWWDKIKYARSVVFEFEQGPGGQEEKEALQMQGKRQDSGVDAFGGQDRDEIVSSKKVD